MAIPPGKPRFYRQRRGRVRLSRPVAALTGDRRDAAEHGISMPSLQTLELVL